MITEDIFVEDLVREYPRLIRPLAEHNLVCIACGEPVWGNLKDLAQSRGVSNLDVIIQEMNELITEAE